MTRSPASSTATLDQQVRYSVFRHFMSTGLAPSVAEAARALSREQPAVAEAYQRLQAAHAFALAPGTSNIWMCHPFSAVPTPFRVHTAERDYWANCAWDTLGISTVLGVDSTAEIRCPDCTARLTVTVKDGSLVEAQGVVHFAVAPRHFWDNVGFT